MSEQQQGAQSDGSRFLRVLCIFLVLVAIGEGFAIAALLDPLKIRQSEMIYPQAVLPSASPSPSRAAYQFPPVSKQAVPGTLQCPDQGSVAAAAGDDKTEVLVISGNRDKPVMLLGDNRRVVVANQAIMSGSVTMCGDGATVLIIGTIRGPVLMRGNGVKIVVQDGDATKLPPAYSMSNGTALRCTTGRADPETPNCNNYVPRPQPKPSG